MGAFLDSVPVSAIIKIRDLMHTVKDPFRLDQGDVSFDAPESVKRAMAKAITENRTHYLPTTGVPRLRELLTEKMRAANGIPIGSADEVVPTNGGTHGIWAVMHALFEPGDEVIVADPEWPATMAIAIAAKANPVAVPLHETLGWRWDLDELERAITPRTKAVYINSPNNPTGGVLTRADLERVAAMATERDLWVLSDEAYEHIIYQGEHVSIASLPGMYARTIPIYTFSKSYAMTGLRLGYFALQDPALRARAVKVVAYTSSNVNSVVQYGGIGALEGSQDCITGFRTELKARRDLFYAGLADAAGGVLSGSPPDGAFYAFVKINPDWARDAGVSTPSLSWAFAEHLIKQARIGCVPGVDFGASGEGFLRFAIGRERKELEGALASMKTALAPMDHGVR
ncbi:MAG TPA: pyridoxal phosphate-dependent aminotransferase [Vicinamibacterales bacterium]|nr:pyridoxal phosphate-dependent aminotransferase [Vicinamibacterales bacterium]